MTIGIIENITIGFLQSLNFSNDFLSSAKQYHIKNKVPSTLYNQNL